MPAIIYFVTVLLYVWQRKNLPAEKGFNLGKWEWPVIIIALVWLVFELLIFRDASFKDPWIYLGVMFAIGLIYFVYMIATKRSMAMPGKALEPRMRQPRGAEDDRLHTHRTAGTGRRVRRGGPQAPEKGHRAALPVATIPIRR